MKIKRIVVESVLLAIVALFVGTILEKANIYYFLPANYLPSLVELFKNMRIFGIIFYFITFGLIAVLIEEAIFRLIPYLLLGKNLKPLVYWILGIITSLLFSISHTNLKNGFEFPLIQFSVGLYLWSLIRKEKGYRLAVLSHFTFNFIILLVCILMPSLF